MDNVIDPGSRETASESPAPSSNTVERQIQSSPFTRTFSTLTNMYTSPSDIDFSKSMAVHGPKGRDATTHVFRHSLTMGMPIFTISMCEDRLGKSASYALYEEVDECSLLLAKIDNGESLDHTITLLPLSESSDEWEMPMRARSIGTKGVGFRFTVDIGDGVGDNFRREEFEWRLFGKDNELDIMGIDSSFRLLRISTQGTQAIIEGKSPLPGTAETLMVDGYEVVAEIMGPPPSECPNGSYYFDLNFYGIAEEGELGNRWGIVTLLTARKIWDMHCAGKANWETIHKLEQEAQ
ncbi:hypothetical protein F5Y04DRAFT_274825 [Hypomontagnella monticulosa]|nr:hypothetical protein F5Y04DRAFT_274825 [Hypomontagnella monticulosa]